MKQFFNGKRNTSVLFNAWETLVDHTNGVSNLFKERFHRDLTDTLRRYYAE